MITARTWQQYSAQVSGVFTPLMNIAGGFPFSATAPRLAAFFGVWTERAAPLIAWYKADQKRMNALLRGGTLTMDQLITSEAQQRFADGSALLAEMERIKANHPEDYNAWIERGGWDAYIAGLMPTPDEMATWDILGVLREGALAAGDARLAVAVSQVAAVYAAELATIAGDQALIPTFGPAIAAVIAARADELMATEWAAYVLEDAAARFVPNLQGVAAQYEAADGMGGVEAYELLFSVVVVLEAAQRGEPPYQGYSLADVAPVLARLPDEPEPEEDDMARYTDETDYPKLGPFDERYLDIDGDEDFDPRPLPPEEPPYPDPSLSDPPFPDHFTDVPAPPPVVDREVYDGYSDAPVTYEPPEAIPPPSVPAQPPAQPTPSVPALGIPTTVKWVGGVVLVALAIRGFTS